MRKIKRVLATFFACILILLTMLYFLQEKLIFLPSKLPADYTFSFDEPFEEFYLTAEDGAKLNALHFKNENPHGVILYFHGNAGDLSRWGQEVQFLVKLHYDVVVMDYRTYGKSTGNLSEAALLKDARLFYDYVASQYSDQEIIIYGRSLGTAMASYLASAESPSLLILETPFYSLLDVAQNRFPLLPVNSLLKYQFRSYQYLQAAKCPIVIIHGDKDGVVPLASAHKLYQSLEGKNAEFITIEGGEHNNLSSFQTYKIAITSLLSSNQKMQSSVVNPAP
jgi:pimeloyl-ACP methyl ester carboxylesterase